MPPSVLDCVQRSPEWHLARCGRLTGSCAGIIYANPRKGQAESVQRRDLRMALALERIAGVPIDESDFLGHDMQRGVEFEDAARAAYASRTGELVERVGFVSHPDLMAGCSPDGVVGPFEGLIEIKCPKPAIHWAYVNAAVVPEDYRPQMIHACWITGAGWCDFVSYSPSVPDPLHLFICRLVPTAAELASHELAVRLFLKECDTQADEIRARLSAA